MFQPLQFLGARLRDRGGFLGPVITLISGTIVAHSITGAALVILARLYSPGDFGVLGMFSSIVYTLAVAACLRLDIAIVLPESEEKAVDLLWLSLLAALSVALLAFMAIELVPFDRIASEGFRAVLPYLWLVPVNLLAAGCAATMQGWLIRKRAYRLLSTARVVQSSGAATMQIGAGWLAPAPIGLIAGIIVNSAAAVLVVLPRLAKAARAHLGWPGWRRLRDTLTEYRDFPRYSVWEALANSAAIQLPILLIGVLTNAREVGQLALAMSVVQAPMALVGTATAQVFMARAPAEAREGHLRQFTIRTLVGVAKVGGPALFCLGVAAPFVFPLVFGENWARAGLLVTWMTPWLLVQFLASPVSSVFSVTGQLRAAMLLQLTGLVFRLGAVWIGAHRFAGTASEAYALSGFLFYVGYLAIVIIATRSRDKMHHG